jgi:hypothetical protein
MRHLGLIFSLIISQSAFCQLSFDSTKKELIYSEVVQSPNNSSNQIYLNINEWFAKTYNSSNNVIQLNDKESGKIIGKGGFTISPIHQWGNIKTPQTFFVNYTLTIQIKDGKYKYEFSNITVRVTQENALFSIEAYYNINKEKLREEAAKSIKNEKQLEKLVESTYNFQNEIFKLSDENILSIIKSIKNNTVAKKDDW